MKLPLCSFLSRQKAFLCLLGLSFTGFSASGQTNPAAQTLPYSQDFSGLTHVSTTYPAGWQGWDVGTSASSSFRTNAPTANRAITASSSANTTSGGVHNYNGKIGILASGSVDPALALAISTTGLSGIKVSYDIMTIRNPYDGSSNTRINEATLQYRVGTSGAFTSLTGIEYSNNTTTQTTAVTTPQNTQSKSVTLPAACNDQSVVQLRWVMRDVSGGGSRPSFAVDNISVCSTPVFSLGASPSVCRGVTSTTLSYTVTSGFSAPNQYSIDYDAAANTAGFADVALTSLPSSPITLTVPGGASSGTYNGTLTIQNSCGNTAAANFTVTINPLPTGSITGPPPFPGPSNDTLCTTIPYVFTGPPGMSAHKWGVSANGTINGSSTGSSVTITPTGFGTLQVRDTITDANGCTSILLYSRNIQQAPTCAVNGPLSVCGGSTGNVYTAISTGGTFSYYVWSISGDGVITSSPTSGFGLTSVTVTAGASGMYTVTVDIKFSFNTCIKSCSETVTINSASTPTITGPTAVCSGGSVTLDAGAGYSAYSWSGGGGSGQTATYTNVTSPTTYTVTVTSNGCTGTDTHTVTINPPPGCSVSGADYVCSNSAGNVYTAPGGMSAYSWGISGAGTITSATNGSSVTVTAGNFLSTYTVSVTVTDANGCTSSCSKASDIFLLTPPANITVNPNPACFGATLDLSIAAASSSTVSWTGEGITNSNGAFVSDGFGGFYNQTTAIPTTTGPHIYTVTVTANPWGCVNTGTATVTVNPLPPAPSCPANSSTCLNVPAYALSGGSPGGGVYSGPGVSAGNFNPATAGIGPHTITYTVTDGNGCSNNCSFTITVNAPPAPTVTGPATVCSGGSVTLDAGAGYSAYAWSGAGGSGQTATYNGIGSATTYTVTVTDGNGCTGTDSHLVTLQSCQIDFSGNIKFSNNNTLGVNNALVTLAGSAPGSDLTDTNGDFFISTALTNGSFTLKPTKTTLKLNGVTVADATAVQQHVSLSNPITDPYKLVAADVNKSNSITTLDASIINQALLGNPSALAQFQTSWRFVPTSHTMTNPPWGFPEQRTYTNVSGPQTNQNFFGIKTGDIVTAFANPANFGAGTPLLLTVNDQRLEAGQELDVPVRAGQLNDLAAFQCALAFDPAQLQLIAIEPAGGLPLSADNFGTYQKDAGEIRVVWAGNKSAEVPEGAPAFRLRLKALQSGAALSEVLRLDGDALPALSYNSKLEESAVALQFETATTGSGDPARDNFRLLPNRPNPFSAETTIGFVLPQACEAQLRIFDATGRLLIERKGQYPAGRSEERLGLEGATGLLWYELTTPFGTLTKTMTALQK